MAIECEVCKRKPENGVTVYRVSPIGDYPALWRCEDHPCEESLKSEAGTADIVAAIEGKKIQ